MRRAFILVPLILTACDANTASTGPRREWVADAVSAQKGRYQLIPASVSFPPLMLDTATGCVKSISVGQDGQVKFSGVTLGDDLKADLDKCNQHLFLRTDVVGKLK